MSLSLLPPREESSTPETGLTEAHGMNSVEHIRTLGEVDPTEWGRLDNIGATTSYGWLRTVEDSFAIDGRQHYFVVRDSDGLLAAAPCSVQEAQDPTANLDTVMFGRAASVARRLRAGTLPALVCGPRFGVGEPLLFRTGTSVELRSMLAAQILSTMEEAAQERGYTLCCRDMPTGTSATAAVLAQRRYLKCRELPSTRLELRWNSFEDYRREVKRTHPSTEKNIRNDANRLARAGFAIRKLDQPAALEKQLHDLLDSHCVRLNGAPFPFRANLFSCLQRYLPGKTVCYVAERDGQLAGTLLGFRHGASTSFPFVGIEEKAAEGAAIYSNLAYNRPIQDEIAAGQEAIFYGKAVYEMKVRRGCELIDADLYLRGRNPIYEWMLRPLLSRHETRLKKRWEGFPRASLTDSIRAEQ